MSNITCAEHSESTKVVISSVIAAGSWIKPGFLFLDLIGHTLCFLAFYKQWKSQNGSVYAFQLYEKIARTIDTFAAFIYLITLQYLAGGNSDRMWWFQGNYYLMSMTAHVPIPLTDTTTTVALCLSLVMSIDRAYAISRPMKYKAIKRRRWEIGALIGSILIGISTCTFSAFLLTVAKIDGDLYRIVPDQNFGGSKIPIIFGAIRSVVWITLLIGIVTSGVYMVHVYRKNLKTVAVMTRSNNSEGGQKQRTEVDKTLFALVIYDSVQAANEIIILITHTFLSYQPSFTSCPVSKLFLAIRNIEIGMINASDFYVMLALSKPFRKVIKKGLWK